MCVSTCATAIGVARADRSLERNDMCIIQPTLDQVINVGHDWYKVVFIRVRSFSQLQCPSLLEELETLVSFSWMSVERLNLSPTRGRSRARFNVLFWWMAEYCFLVHGKQ